MDGFRYDRRNARSSYATGNSAFQIRAHRRRFLPTEHGHAALLPETGAIREYQSDSSSKRPVSSIPSASGIERPDASFPSPEAAPRLLCEAKERKR